MVEPNRPSVCRLFSGQKRIKMYNLRGMDPQNYDCMWAPQIPESVPGVKKC